MANKLYEEESIRDIANKIRLVTNQYSKRFTVARMANAIQDVFDIGYERGELIGANNGYAEGLVDGAGKVKTDEARTEDDIGLSVSEISVGITIPSGYYADTIEKVLDVQNGDLDPITDAAYDEGLEVGYQNGYNDGINAGGGGGSPSTVWEITSKPSLTGLPTSSSAAIEVSFTSNGIDFNGIYGDSSLGLYYCKADGSTQNVYAPKMGIWVNSAYKTIATHGEINNSTLFTWLQTNATLLSIGSE